jgi:hypothetical protein
MAIKTLLNPVRWRSVDAATADSDIGLSGEPVIDWRDGKPYLRIMNGITPGGRIVGEGLLDSVDKPFIVSPIDGAINITVSPIITASDYSSVNTNPNITHFFSIWEIATDINFTNVIYNSGTDSSSKTAIDLGSKGISLLSETIYYVRVRYVNNASYMSLWSNPSSFTTSDSLPIYQTSKLLSSDNNLGDYFGYDVDISGNGNAIVVGSYGAESVNTDTGAAFVYKRIDNNWIQETKLVASDVETGDYFGYAVSISGDGNTVVVTSPLENEVTIQAGAAYIFKYVGGSWVQDIKITDINGSYLDRLGVATAVNYNGDRVAIGAAWRNSGSYWDNGAVYVYRLESSIWYLEAILEANIGETYAYYGRAVGMSANGSVIVVGAAYADVVGYESGAAYIYTREGNNWTETTRLVPSDATAESYFGESVAISGDGNTVAIGAHLADTTLPDTGAVYIYRNLNGTWVQSYKVMPTEVNTGDKFGLCVSLNSNGTLLTVAAENVSGGPSTSGGCYLFALTEAGWTQQSVLLSTDIEVGDGFASSSVISGDGSTIIMGSPNDDDGGASSGSVYIFE